jgi:hypothetical protein
MLLSIIYLRCLDVIFRYFCFTIGYNLSNDIHFVCFMSDIKLLWLFFLNMVTYIFKNENLYLKNVNVIHMKGIRA